MESCSERYAYDHPNPSQGAIRSKAALRSSSALMTTWQMQPQQQARAPIPGSSIVPSSCLSFPLFSSSASAYYETCFEHNSFPHSIHHGLASVVFERSFTLHPTCSSASSSSSNLSPSSLFFRPASSSSSFPIRSISELAVSRLVNESWLQPLPSCSQRHP